MYATIYYIFSVMSVIFLLTDPGGKESKLNGTLQSTAEAAIGRQLSEPGRFACAALCGVSLGYLFQGSEQR